MCVLVNKWQGQALPWEPMPHKQPPATATKKLQFPLVLELQVVSAGSFVCQTGVCFCHPYFQVFTICGDKTGVFPPEFLALITGPGPWQGTLGLASRKSRAALWGISSPWQGHSHTCLHCRLGETEENQICQECLSIKDRSLKCHHSELYSKNQIFKKKKKVGINTAPPPRNEWYLFLPSLLFIQTPLNHLIIRL